MEKSGLNRIRGFFPSFLPAVQDEGENRVKKISIRATVLLAWMVSWNLPVLYSAEKLLDLTKAVVVVPTNLTRPEQNAVRLLVEETAKRASVVLPQQSTWPSRKTPRIVAATVSSAKSFGGSFSVLEPAFYKPEGYRIWIENSNGVPSVFVVGNDSRGMLFGIGHLLRTLRMSKGHVRIPDGLKAVSSPRYAIRGHQLGYRPKPNSYDGWTLAIWEQYIRDLAVFGTNAIELIPPRSDDAPDSPHFPLPQMETMVGMSKIADDYGLDVWVWYPALDKDYSDPKTVESSVGEWSNVLRQLPRLNAVFVPCGDPGATPPELLMPLLAKQADALKRFHPDAGWWIAPQGFGLKQIDTFRKLIDANPPWLTGVCYGPWCRMPLDEFRKFIPARYPIRHYPDITHSVYCQYPVPDWDLAFAATEGREVINPRPLDQASIFRATQQHTVGFITYSEGCNDDVNKIVWSSLGWNPNADVTDILRDYSRFFIGESYAVSFAQGLLALEENWRGPAVSNKKINTTFRQFLDMERSAPPRLRLNWRFQQGLFRAHYDAYVKSRLEYETGLEAETWSILRSAKRMGSSPAMETAKAVLNRAVIQPVSEELRDRLFDLAEALYQSIRMQLHTQRYNAQRSDGAVLDRVDVPLNNRLWLMSKFEGIDTLQLESERLAKIQNLLDWTNPGQGGFYDDLGDPMNQPHLETGAGFDCDPYFLKTPLSIMDESLRRLGSSYPMTWKSTILGLYDLPIRLSYSKLDSAASYMVRVVYTDGPIRLVANGTTEIHPLLDNRHKILEFDIPASLTSHGALNLAWMKNPGEGHAGRGNQIAEVWLVRK